MTKKAIGLAEYNELLQNQQFDILHRDGVYIGKKKAGNKTIVLFQLYGFYVEVYYRQYRKHIEYTVSSDNPDILHDYIDQVQVRDLGGDTNV